MIEQVAERGRHSI